VSDLQVTTERPQAGHVLLILQGELDVSTTGRVEREIHLVEIDHPAVISLDLRRLAFIDSTGLRTILRADARARAEGRSFVVIRGAESVDRVFRVTMLDRHLTLLDEPMSGGPPP
jgi:anti-sigma B factor antagonist